MKRSLILIFIISIFSVPAFSQSTYFEFKLSSNGQVMGTMKAYSRNGDTRSEVSFEAGPEMFKGTTLVALKLKNKPDVIYNLNDKKKTYSELDAGKKENEKDYEQVDYEVTLVGKEKINGYNTTHVKIKNKKTQSAQEMWTTTEIAGYGDLLKTKTAYTGKENLVKALAAKGAIGFPVRILATEKVGAVTLDLVKADKRDNAASLFSLDGYTKEEAPAKNQAMQEMMDKIKNMTPEEREKYLKQLKEQYQQQPK